MAPSWMTTRLEVWYWAQNAHNLYFSIFRGFSVSRTLVLLVSACLSEFCSLLRNCAKTESEECFHLPNTGSAGFPPILNRYHDSSIFLSIRHGKSAERTARPQEINLGRTLLLSRNSCCLPHHRVAKTESCIITKLGTTQYNIAYLRGLFCQKKQVLLQIYAECTSIIHGL